MSTLDHALRVLRGGHARRIRFQYRGVGGATIAVGPESFTRVATALHTHKIRLDGPANLPAGADAAYNPNNFVDPVTHLRHSGWLALSTNYYSRLWEACLIHEAVHASFDLTGSRLTMADNEAAAYVASAMFCLMVGLPVSRWRTQMGNELTVRGSAQRALRNATITSDVRELREILILEHYNGSPSNPSPMGTVANPTSYTGDR